MITSREQTFEGLSNTGVDALAVRSGLPAEDLMDLSSRRLAETIELLREQAEGDEGLSQNTLYVVQNQLEVAKAMLDACIDGLVKFGGRART
ncbi:hypothetical protein ACT048_04825 [Ectopseudomonas khazarica]|uniref:hypothetical protein n=1 Tax=Ectopseudomonas khazarica TaxID=2502979 RepID=UPI004033A830